MTETTTRKKLIEALVTAVLTKKQPMVGAVVRFVADDRKSVYLIYTGSGWHYWHTNPSE